jgi:hypothetical protein
MPWLARGHHKHISFWRALWGPAEVSQLRQLCSVRKPVLLKVPALGDSR